MQETGNRSLQRGVVLKVCIQNKELVNLSAAEGSCRNSIKLPRDPSATLSMTDFPLNHFWDFEYTL